MSLPTKKVILLQFRTHNMEMQICLILIEKQFLSYPHMLFGVYSLQITFNSFLLTLFHDGSSSVSLTHAHEYLLFDRVLFTVPQSVAKITKFSDTSRY